MLISEYNRRRFCAISDSRAATCRSKTSLRVSFLTWGRRSISILSESVRVTVVSSLISMSSLDKSFVPLDFYCSWVRGSIATYLPEHAAEGRYPEARRLNVEKLLPSPWEMVIKVKNDRSSKTLCANSTARHGQAAKTSTLSLAHLGVG